MLPWTARRHSRNEDGARMPDDRDLKLGRRDFIKTGSAAALMLATGNQAACGGVANTMCEVTPTYQDGPFYVNTLKLGLERRDVTEGLAGAPLLVRLTLIDARTCAPLSDLAVDIWSASPRGLYSGVDNSLVLRGGADTQGETYMRGHQFSDEAGEVLFESLFPGWYEVTPPHIHFTIPFPDGKGYTWQFFLTDDFSERVYTTVEPYKQRGAHPTRTSGVRRAYDALILTPTGPPHAPVIDAVVGIDMENLEKRADEFQP